MNSGTQIRLLSDPGRCGITTGKSRIMGNRIFWQVIFPDGSQYISEKQFEIVNSEPEDPIELFLQGKFGRVRDLRGIITHIRLSGRLADLIYSMETTNTDFYPYQFKPVLNFLDSPGHGILIADEVGLGKTIEAGLIWTELRSRYDTRRLMVLCPAMLREKWKLELQHRFGINANIVDANEVLQTLKEFRSGHLTEFAIIASMQGLRPYKNWDNDDTIAKKTSVKLAKFLDDNSHDENLFDLLIIDEAHYLRNSQSMTSKLGRLLRNVSDHIVLLSATPIHLKNEDLYNLLNLVDEDSFNQIHVFDDILMANAPLIKARDMILQGETNVDKFINQLKEAKTHTLLVDNRQLQAILNNPPTYKELQNNNYRSKLAHRLECINLLGHAVTRTRKREVTEWRVIREAIPEMIEMTPVEEEFYTKVTDIVRKYCYEHDAHEGFLLVTPQRQISSSMPAALQQWQRRKLKADTLYEDLGEDWSDNNDIGPLVQTILDNTEEIGNLQELWENDSKYNRFSSELKRYLKDHPHDKIIVFAYFKPTLYYLHDRLASENINSILLVGGAKIDKYEIINSFKEQKGPNILLASEVASEGIDLQFSRVLVNYDLPWNPMKVEQRIGRIDRLGQLSPKITIWNLFYANTIDARIYDRLYERLGIFKYALGGLEAVLGEEIKKLTIDLLKGKLTNEQEEIRITQTEQAISNLREQEERLEKNANNLIAHGDYILNQVRAARELGRWITGEDLWIYMRDFFNNSYPGCEFRQKDPNELLFEVRLSEDARFDLDSFLRKNNLIGKTRLVHSFYESVYCYFNNQVKQLNHVKYEYINQFHPLTKFVTETIKNSISLSKTIHFPTISLILNHKEISKLNKQDYIFYVELWSVQGIRDIEKLVYFAIPTTGDVDFIEEDLAEQLVTTAAKSGKDWLSAANEINITLMTPLIEKCIDIAERQYTEYISFIENENNDRADLQEKSLKIHMERQRLKLQEVLKIHELRGNQKMIAPIKGKINKMEMRVRNKIRYIDERRKLMHHKKNVCIGLIRVE